ncbi:tRNA (5-methylaminomethyl-2-thiouridylate)-methyltransferase [Magnetococcus marinus MC-1]|uniref:tRNA-specific 2-thiouridylase MnmA n=1 Tax=Magnetococcus marinus (strain ATCC BAA-1437 / JCM 17883 / MC-1) TaxID=156889 RepID=MNMA_MAGMM|nr:tRNA 2-thiouridine(34) synthase MnmA [Magnetococcus marinus]A0L678.1 RecName: Full=tRNA-specific 2-thiouridylase MnmA [Magnetococcus marinus MC-1]ABK43471.1 tRNA (5-methylaminomethyl-2-thiouridylate)-methyltransferase [Magnetococcus marinus MC-1]
MTQPQRVAVAMSGGVDSSATAALLVEQGYEVIGLTMQLWDHSSPKVAGSRSCCALDDLYDARQVAQTLGIPYYVVNYEADFRQAVVDDFIQTYAAGQTPNPCVRCNQILKFDLLLKKALALGADFLATGHYAIRREDAQGVPQLWQGSDPAKDQSYFLFTTTMAQLAHVRFPLGEMDKQQTRQLAQRFGLHLSTKQESQDVCFVPDGDYSAFFAKQAPHLLTPGAIVDQQGHSLGQHKGLGCYTVGQRKGLGIAHPTPLYVLALDAPHNQVIVGPAEALYQQQLTLHHVNWLEPTPPTEPFASMAKIRYAAPPVEARVEPLPDGGAQIYFNQPQRAITPGQACVFYDGARVVGGGWIV